MIYLVTGLPGNGKTLYTLWHLRERAKRESRQVYYSGIPQLQIPEWIELTDDQARNWHELPEGSLIVIDEAQRLFRPRPGRGEPPPHVALLETHRHRGYDIYLITQHPTLIDQNVRRLTGAHRHVVRTFGLNRAVIHEWGEVRLDCERRRQDSSKTNWKYPKDVFKIYKSAEAHTHGLQMPKQVYYLVGLLALLVALSIYLYQRVSDRTSKPEAELLTSTAPALTFTQAVYSPQSSEKEKPLTPAEYVATFQPRIEGLPHTAPRYDELTKPTEAPYPAGCLKIAKTCKCYTTQGTKLETPEYLCRQIIAGGIFKDWSGNPSAGRPARDEAGRPVEG